MNKEAMKLALEALIEIVGAYSHGDSGADYEHEPWLAKSFKAIKALEETLAKQEEQTSCDKQGEPVAVVIEESTFDGYLCKGIAWNFRLDSFDIGTKFYTTPQPASLQNEAQRTWVGLTEEEVIDLWPDLLMHRHTYQFWQNLEAKLKEKNT